MANVTTPGSTGGSWHAGTVASGWSIVNGNVECLLCSFSVLPGEELRNIFAFAAFPLSAGGASVPIARSPWLAQRVSCPGTVERNSVANLRWDD